MQITKKVTEIYTDVEHRDQL